MPRLQIEGDSHSKYFYFVVETVVLSSEEEVFAEVINLKLTVVVLRMITSDDKYQEACLLSYYAMLF